MKVENQKKIFCQLPLVWQNLIIKNIAEILVPNSLVLDDEFSSYLKKVRENQRYRRNDEYKFVWTTDYIYRVVWEQIADFSLHSSYNLDTIFYNDYFFPAFKNLKCFTTKSKTSYKNILSKFFPELDIVYLQTIENFSFNEFKNLKALNEEAHEQKFRLFAGLSKKNDPHAFEKDNTSLYDEYKSFINANEKLGFLDPLQLFENLIEVSLPFCFIRDVSIISKLRRLKKINLCGNPISSFPKDISSSNLRDLDISKTNTSDISWIKNLKKLNQIDLSNTFIEDISPLSELKNLKYLAIKSCRISDIEALSGCINITILELENNKINSFLPISFLVKLRELNLYDCGLSDFSGLEKLSQLISLIISKNEVQVISHLTKLKNIEILYIDECSIKNASFIKYCKKIKLLSIENNSISDMNFLSTLTDLERLDISNNRIASLDGLQSLKKLKWINLNNNLISSLKGIEPCLFSLEMIRFGGMTIESLLPLMNLPDSSSIMIDYPETVIVDQQSVDIFFQNHRFIKYFNGLMGVPLKY